MKPPGKRTRHGGKVPEFPPEMAEEPLKDGSDICQQLMDRYAKSSAPQHRHLIATAAATRAILSAESLPLSPASYFFAAMANLDSGSPSTESLSSTEMAALLSFLVIVIPAVPPKGIVAPKAKEAVEVLARLVVKEGGEEETLGVSTVRSAVKCIGVLLGFCALEDWDSLEFGFETLLKFAVDKRPKVRRCAQECLENAFKLLRSSSIVKKLSELVFSWFEKYVPLAVELSASPVFDETKDETPSESEHVEVLHMLNVVTLALPSLSADVKLKIVVEVSNFFNSRYSVLTRHILKIIEAFLGSAKVEDAPQEVEGIVVSLCSYVSSDGNPVDTVILAAQLLIIAMDKLPREGSESMMNKLPAVFRTLAGILALECESASQASNILKELINRYVDEKALLNDSQLLKGGDDSAWGFEASAVKAICIALDNVLKTRKGIPTENMLAIISVLFLKLGGCSDTYMKSILFKLAELMIHNSGDASGMNHLSLRRCFGSAVVAIGPEKMLTLFPITLHSEDFSYTNFWLVPILKDYVIGSSLNYYMENIVPLAKSFQLASRKAGRSGLRKDLKNCAHDLWKLLTAFCRHPVDTNKQFRRLAKLLAALLDKHAFMHESVALALKVLVNENRGIAANEKELEQNSLCKESMVVFQNIQPYSTKTATKNLKALASSSNELMQILCELFINSDPGKRLLLKDAIVCLACIIDSSFAKEIFSSLLKRVDFLTSGGELLSSRSDSDTIPSGVQEIMTAPEGNIRGSVTMELASCLVEEANQDLIESIFDFVKQTFQETNELGHGEAYHTLSKILEEHEWFRSSHYVEVLDILFGLKTPSDTAILNGRFACFNILMVHTLKMNLLEEEEAEEKSKGFLILKEIILTFKDAKEEARKEACDILLMMSSNLKNISSGDFDSLYNKFINMIMGYLSGSSPHITSGAVSALSVLLYKDPDLCFLVPELVPSLLSLLQSKAVEVVKAVLGFFKVLVSCVPTEVLQDLLHDLVAAIIPWSSVSRHHFRSKVTVILEIIIRKCGFAALESVIPEKYKRFLKTVSENRRNKTSKETDNVDNGTNSTDFHNARLQKRRHDQHSESGTGNDSREHKRSKREWKDNSNFRGSEFGKKGAQEGSQNFRNNERKPFKVPQRGENGKRGKRNFGGHPSDGENRVKRRDVNKKFEGNNKNQSASKSYNRKFSRAS